MMLKNLNDLLTIITLLILILLIPGLIVGSIYRNHERNSFFNTFRMFLNYDENTDE